MIRVAEVVLGVLIVLIVYLLVLVGVSSGAQHQCEAVAQEGIVLKATVDFFNPTARTCIYADEQGLVHKVDL